MALDAHPDDDNAAPDTVADPAPVKRGRGRPRKYPRPGDAAYEAAKAAQATKLQQQQPNTALVPAEPVPRDKHGRILPGNSLNPGGLSAQQKRVRAQLEGMNDEAVARLRELIHSPNENVALGAVKELLTRTQPAPPKAAPNIAVQVNTGDRHSADGRLQSTLDLAVQRLREQERAKVLAEHGIKPAAPALSPPVIDVTPARVVVDAYQSGNEGE
jgi:hypothetical protein